MNSQITIFGATGFTGKELVRQALERRYRVKVLARSAERLGDLASKVDVIEGAYFKHPNIDKALEGSQYVLSTIGPPLDAKSKNVDVEKYHQAFKYLVQSIKTNDIEKFIHISGAGIIYPNEALPFSRKLMRFALKVFAAPVSEVKHGEMKILFDSDIPFISIRPPLIKEIEGSIKAHTNSLNGMSVGVKQLANFMLDNLVHAKWDKKAPVVGC